MRFLLAGIALSSVLASTAAAAALEGPRPPAGWELVWSDEFDKPGRPDPSRWGYDVGGDGWGNNELEYYTRARPENARVERGHLVIEARKEPWNKRSYTSARLVSRGEGWTYGRVEVRAKLPGGRGTWPATWMLPTRSSYGGGGWPATGELDIMEYVGYAPGVIHASVHCQAYNWPAKTQKTATYPVADAEKAFRVYALERSEDRVDFFVDDARVLAFPNDRKGWRTWPFDKPFHLLLNVAVGGMWGGKKGVDDSIFPQRMEVDYVRVYRRAPAPRPH